MMDRVVAGKLLKQAISESTEEEGRDCSWIMLRLVDLAVEHERNRCAKVFQRRMERVLFSFKEELDACVSSVKGEE